MIQKEKKTAIIAEYATHEGDTGSPEVQIAILTARIRRVFYGARDDVMGACGGVLNLYMENFPRPPQLTGGICAEECRAVLKTFFSDIRGKNPDSPRQSPTW